MGTLLTSYIRGDWRLRRSPRAWIVESSTRQKQLASRAKGKPDLSKASLSRGLGWLFLVAVGLSGCGSPTPNFGQPVHLGGTSSWVYALAGPVARSPFLLALVTNRYGAILAYACDGQQVAEWFQGPLQGTMANLTTSDGAHLQVMLASTEAQGILTLPKSTPLTFQIGLVTEPAGLYRAKQLVNGVVYLGGWILLADGRQAGMIQTPTEQLSGPHLDPAHPTITLLGGGTLTPQLVTPQSDL